MEFLLAAFEPVHTARGSDKGASLYAGARPENDKGANAHPGIYSARPGKKSSISPYLVPNTRSFREASASEACREILSKSESPRKTRPQTFRPAQEVASTVRGGEGLSSQSLSPEKTRPSQAFRPVQHDTPWPSHPCAYTGQSSATDLTNAFLQPPAAHSSNRLSTDLDRRDRCGASPTGVASDSSTSPDGRTQNDSELMAAAPVLVAGLKLQPFQFASCQDISEGKQSELKTASEMPVVNLKSSQSEASLSLLKGSQSGRQDAISTSPISSKPFKMVPERARGLHHSLNGELRGLEDDMHDLAKDLNSLGKLKSSQSLQSLHQDAVFTPRSPQKPSKAFPERARGLHHSLNGELRSLEDDMADLTKDLLALRAGVSSFKTLIHGETPDDTKFTHDPHSSTTRAN